MQETVSAKSKQNGPVIKKKELGKHLRFVSLENKPLDFPLVMSL